MSLPTIPDGLGQREDTTRAGLLATKMKLQHHLVECPLENVRDVRALYFLTQPPLVFLQGFRKALPVKPQCILEVLDGKPVGAMKIHGLHFEDSIPGNVYDPHAATPHFHQSYVK